MSPIIPDNTQWLDEEKQRAYIDQASYSTIIADAANRMLWKLRNVIECLPEELWCELLCGQPLWKHIYHTLSSLDRWLINPDDADYIRPAIHRPMLDDLDTDSGIVLSRREIMDYYAATRSKVAAYCVALTDSQLTEQPSGCCYTRFTLLLGQLRHLHTHMGMIMGIIIDRTGKWPFVLGTTRPIPKDDVFPLFC